MWTLPSDMRLMQFSSLAATHNNHPKEAEHVRSAQSIPAIPLPHMLLRIIDTAVPKNVFGMHGNVVRWDWKPLATQAQEEQDWFATGKAFQRAQSTTYSDQVSLQPPTMN